MPYFFHVLISILSKQVLNFNMLLLLTPSKLIYKIYSHVYIINFVTAIMNWDIIIYQVSLRLGKYMIFY